MGFLTSERFPNSDTLTSPHPDARLHFGRQNDQRYADDEPLLPCRRQEAHVEGPGFTGSPRRPPSHSRLGVPPTLRRLLRTPSRHGAAADQRRSSYFRTHGPRFTVKTGDRAQHDVQEVEEVPPCQDSVLKTVRYACYHIFFNTRFQKTE